MLTVRVTAGVILPTSTEKCNHVPKRYRFPAKQAPLPGCGLSMPSGRSIAGAYQEGEQKPQNSAGLQSRS